MYVLFSLIRFVLRVLARCLEQGWKESMKAANKFNRSQDVDFKMEAPK
jgi:hypothetical protein